MLQSFLLRLRRKALSAATRRFRVRIFQGETRGQQVVLVEVEHRAVEQLVALRIDEHLRAVRAFEHLIGIARRAIPRKHVAETRAAAGLHGDAQAALGLLIFLELLADDPRRALSDLNHGLLSTPLRRPSAPHACARAPTPTSARPVPVSPASPRQSRRPRATRPPGLRSRWRRCSPTP